MIKLIKAIEDEFIACGGMKRPESQYHEGYRDALNYIKQLIMENTGCCKDCKWWERVHCINPKTKHFDDVYESNLLIALGEDFGCIHWRKK